MLLESFADLRAHPGVRSAGRPQSAVSARRGGGRRVSDTPEAPRPASSRDPASSREARHRERLLHELQRAQTRAAQRKACAPPP